MRARRCARAPPARLRVAWKETGVLSVRVRGAPSDGPEWEDTGVGRDAGFNARRVPFTQDKRPFALHLGRAGFGSERHVRADRGRAARVLLRRIVRQSAAARLLRHVPNPCAGDRMIIRTDDVRWREGMNRALRGRRGGNGRGVGGCVERPPVRPSVRSALRLPDCRCEGEEPGRGRCGKGRMR